MFQHYLKVYSLLIFFAIFFLRFVISIGDPLQAYIVRPVMLPQDNISYCMPIMGGQLLPILEGAISVTWAIKVAWPPPCFPFLKDNINMAQLANTIHFQKVSLEYNLSHFANGDPSSLWGQSNNLGENAVNLWHEIFWIRILINFYSLVAKEIIAVHWMRNVLNSKFMCAWFL